MAVQYQDIQELLRSRADLHVRLNLMPYDGTPEIKERGDGKYLYVRKRVAGKQTSTYVGVYTEELYNLLLLKVLVFLLMEPFENRIPFVPYHTQILNYIALVMYIFYS